MNKILLAAACSVIFSMAFAALPEPSEIPKDGDCPSNYSAKGNECEPTSQAKFALVKKGECPADYNEEANYCVATTKSKLAIGRAAMRCPKGFEPIGNYCISEK